MKKILKTVAVLMALAMLLCCFAGCSKPASGTVKVATKAMTEQFILGEMLKLVIEEYTDYDVEITKGIAGGAGNIHAALLNGDFDLYPEYTSTGWNDVLKNEPMKDADAMFPMLREQYEENFGLTWLGLYGFNNTYALVVSRATADEYGLATDSDLAKVSSELSFGANADYYEREDGYPALCEAYGFSFKAESDIDIGLKYQALDQGEVDVINGFTTDALMQVYDVVALKDDLSFFPAYYCGTVVRQDSLEKYPGLDDALIVMEGILSDDEMVLLNYRVDNDHEDEETVARDFLVEKGIIAAG